MMHVAALSDECATLTAFGAILTTLPMFGNQPNIEPITADAGDVFVTIP